MPLIHRPPARTPRQRCIRRIEEIVGRDKIRVLYLPDEDDRINGVEDSVYRRPYVHNVTPQGRLTRQGYGWLLAFDPTALHSITIPDTDSLSTITPGGADRGFSFVVAAIVVDTALNRTLMAKYNTGGTQRERLLHVSPTDTLRFFLYDESLDVIPFIASNAAITQAALKVFGATYTAATGGATAASDMAAYQDGSVIATTVTNAGTYVAMENTTAPVTIGALDAATGQYHSGSIGLALDCDALSAQQHRSIVADAMNPYLQVKL